MLIPRKYQSIAAAVLLAASLAVLSYGAVRVSESGFLGKVIVETAAPVQDAIRRSLMCLENLWKRYLFLVGLEDENRRLRGQNAELMQQANLYREESLEAARLRKILDLKSDFPHRAVAARVIDRNRSSLFKTLLINKGTADGLQKGLPVLSGQGGVGRIIEASWNVSRVLLLTDETSSIDGMIQRSRARGILQGAGKKGCNLKYIPRTEEVQAGDVVISAGLSGIFPKGIVLGTVTAVSSGEEGLFHKIEVSPAVEFEKLEEVLALRKEPPSEP